MANSPLAGEVWLCRLDPVEGREQAGIRPVLIVSGHRYNALPSNLIIILPITSRDRNIAFHVRVDPPEGGLRTISFVLADQPRAVSTSRLKERWGMVTRNTLEEARSLVGMFLEG
jgi:mRNA interferase MazF